MDCALNEFFLQMVSAAPKQNGRLVNIMSVVLQSFVAIEEGALGTYALEVQTALQGVARCFRGLLALLSPEIGILGSKSTDVEAVSRNKRAKTVKSGLGNMERGPEFVISQLLCASDWWGQKIEEYWKTAPRAMALQPKLKECLELARNDKSEELLTCEQLADTLETLAEFKAGLREGAYAEYELYVWLHLLDAAKHVLGCQNGDDLVEHGYSNPMPTLIRGFEIFQKNPDSKTKGEELQAWYARMKAVLLQKTSRSC